MIDSNAFYKYQEHRGQAGYKSAILVKEQSATKYSMLVASETVPSVFGSQGSFEFNLLNSPVMGKIADKITLDEKEVECLLHRDNIWRFEQFRGKTLDFMYMTPDFVGYKFSGTVTLKPNDGSADVLRGTYTIVPMTAEETPIFNVRDMVEETLCFADVIPENIKSGESVNLTLVQKDVSVTYKQFNIDNYGKAGEPTDLTVSDGMAKIDLPAGGLVGITATATGYAPWTTTVYVQASAN